MESEWRDASSSQGPPAASGTWKMRKEPPEPGAGRHVALAHPDCASVVLIPDFLPSEV